MIITEKKTEKIIFFVFHFVSERFSTIWIKKSKGLFLSGGSPGLHIIYLGQGYHNGWLLYKCTKFKEFGTEKFNNQTDVRKFWINWNHEFDWVPDLRWEEFSMLYVRVVENYFYWAYLHNIQPVFFSCTKTLYCSMTIS